MVATFHGDPDTTIISCYSPTNVSEELEVEQFYMELASLTRQIPKHNMLVIGGDFNAHLGKLNNSKFSYHTKSNLKNNADIRNKFIIEVKTISRLCKMMKKQYQPTQHTHTLKLPVENHLLNIYH